MSAAGTVITLVLPLAIVVLLGIAFFDFVNRRADRSGRLPAEHLRLRARWAALSIFSSFALMAGFIGLAVSVRLLIDPGVSVPATRWTILGVGIVLTVAGIAGKTIVYRKRAERRRQLY